MASEKFAQLVRDLKDDQWGRKGPGKSAAEAFRQVVVDGEDITGVIPFLIQAYLDSHQLPIICPISDALALHCLNRGETDLLNGLLCRPAFGNYLVASLCDLAGRGKDISLAIPGTIQAFAGKDSEVSMYDLTRILIRHIHGRKTRLSQVTDLMPANPKTAAVYPRFLREAIQNGKQDASEFIPILAGLVDQADPRLKEEILQAILFLIGQGASLETVIPCIEAILADPGDDIRYYAVHSLGLYYAKINTIQPVDQLLASSDPKVREGLTMALSAAFSMSGMDKKVIVSRLTLLLMDPDENVRKRAFEILEGALKRGIQSDLDLPVLNRLVMSLGQASFTPILSPYLLAYVSQSQTMARTVLRVLSSPGVDQNHPALLELKKACEGKIQGTLTHSVQRVRENSAWDLFHHYSRKGLNNQVIALLGHSDPAIRVVISEQLSIKLGNAAPFVEALTQRLNDEDGRVKSRCSTTLASHYVVKKQFEKLHELLAMDDPWVKQMAVLKLSSIGDDVDISPFFPALKQLIFHPSSMVRSTNSYALRHTPSSTSSSR